jgi:hypothetical protein
MCRDNPLIQAEIARRKRKGKTFFYTNYRTDSPKWKNKKRNYPHTHTLTAMMSLQSIECIKAQAELCMEQRHDLYGHPECAIHQLQYVSATHSWSNKVQQKMPPHDGNYAHFTWRMSITVRSASLTRINNILLRPSQLFQRHIRVTRSSDFQNIKQYKQSCQTISLLWIRLASLPLQEIKSIVHPNKKNSNNSEIAMSQHQNLKSHNSMKVNYTNS